MDASHCRCRGSSSSSSRHGAWRQSWQVLAAPTCRHKPLHNNRQFTGASQGQHACSLPSGSRVKLPDTNLHKPSRTLLGWADESLQRRPTLGTTSPTQNKPQHKFILAVVSRGLIIPNCSACCVKYIEDQEQFSRGAISVNCGNYKQLSEISVFYGAQTQSHIAQNFKIQNKKKILLIISTCVACMYTQSPLACLEFILPNDKVLNWNSKGALVKNRSCT